MKGRQAIGAAIVMTFACSLAIVPARPVAASRRTVSWGYDGIARDAAKI